MGAPEMIMGFKFIFPKFSRQIQQNSFFETCRYYFQVPNDIKMSLITHEIMLTDNCFVAEYEQ